MIEKVFDAFMANLGQILTGTETFEVTVGKGADKLRSNNPPPRVLFVLLPAEKIAGQKLYAGGGANGQPMPKGLATREVSFDVHIWGKDRDQAEALINHVANAVHTAAWGSYRFRAGTWQGEDGSVNNQGAYYVLHAEMDIPITRELQSVVFGTEQKPLQFPNSGGVPNA